MGDRSCSESIRTVEDQDPLSLSLPDLILNWAQAAVPEPHQISALDFLYPNVGIRTAQHNDDAFCVVAGHNSEMDTTVSLASLHEGLVASMGQGT